MQCVHSTPARIQSKLLRRFRFVTTSFYPPRSWSKRRVSISSCSRSFFQYKHVTSDYSHCASFSDAAFGREFRGNPAAHLEIIVIPSQQSTRVELCPWLKAQDSKTRLTNLHIQQTKDICCSVDRLMSLVAFEMLESYVGSKI